MTKKEFLDSLEEKISDLSDADIQKSLDYYSEMIDDRIEDGLSEEEAVEAVGNVYEIATSILIDAPMSKIVKTKAKAKLGKISGWGIVLLILGAPLWLPILIAVAAVVLSVYVTIWSVVVALFGAAIGIAVAAIALVIGALPAGFLTASTAAAVFTLGAGFTLTAIGILMFMGSVAVAKGVAVLGKAIWKGTKRIIVGRGKQA